MGEADLEDAVLPWSVREISDDDLYRGKVPKGGHRHAQVNDDGMLVRLWMVGSWMWPSCALCLMSKTTCSG
ncbi:hypothetical protein ZWY2020_031310 [Hordeum vulgare]|nr:hypothetical protein ZWY2020_031310 [Hordeum vulgare]